MTELYGIRFSYGRRGNQMGLWVDNKYVDIMIVNFHLRHGVPYVVTSDGMDILTETVEAFKKRIDHNKTGGHRL
jgi:uncharacterized protein Veg